MELVTSSQFRFTFSGVDPSNPQHEYGAVIKTSFEIGTGWMHSDPGYYDNTAAYPARVCAYFGPINPRLPAANVPVVRFSYFSVMIGPQASGNAISTFNNDFSTPNFDVTARWRWTAGFMTYPYFSDVVWVDTGDQQLRNLDPSFSGSSPNNGIVFLGDFFNSWPLNGSGIFPPVDESNALQFLTGGSPVSPGNPPGSGFGDWDGYPYLNLFLNVATGGTDGAISPGNWRFVHLFSEMT